MSRLQTTALCLALVAALAACTPKAGGKPIPKATDDEILQRAYESCVIDNTKEVRAQNPDLPKSLESSTMERIYHSCETAVVATCSRSKETDACEAVLKMYIKLY